jgi:hypothetical protein
MISALLVIQGLTDLITQQALLDLDGLYVISKKVCYQWLNQEI